MIVGLNAAARILAAEVQRQGGNAILASHQKKAGQQVAQELGCRFVQFEALYSTLHDVLDRLRRGEADDADEARRPASTPATSSPA